MLKNCLKIFPYIIYLILFITLPMFANKNTKQRVVIAYEPSYGIVEDLESIDRKGYGYELFKKLEKYSNYEFELVPYNFAGAIEAVRDGKADAFAPASYTEERAKDFLFTKNSILTEKVILAAPKDSPCFYNDPKCINNKKISAYTGVTLNGYLERYLKEKKIDAKFVYTTEMNTFYFRKDVDFYLVSSMHTFLDYHTVLNLGTDDLYIMVNKNKAELVKGLDKALTEINIHENTFFPELYLKYYGKDSLSLRSLSKEEDTAIKSKKVIKVGYAPNRQPFQYKDKSNQPSGMHIKLMEYFSDLYGFDVEYSVYDPNNINSKEDFDILLFASELTQKEYVATKSYITLPMMLLGDEKQLNNPKKIGILNKYALNINLIKNSYPNSELVFYTNIDNIKNDYLNNHIDVILLSNLESLYVMSKIRRKNFLMNNTNISLPLRMYISKNLPKDFIMGIETIINRLEPSVVDKIVAEESTIYLNEVTIKDFYDRHRFEVLEASIIAIIVLVLFFLLLQWRKKREILKIVNFDNLTGLISMQYFKYQAVKYLKNTKETEYKMITMDIDYFHTINDVFGFEKGNLVIKAIAKTLERTISSPSLITRAAGDQFVILRRRNEQDRSINEICEECIKNEINNILGRGYNFSMSLGIYAIDDREVPIDIIIDRANIARRKGKSSHKNTYTFFDSNMKNEYKRRTNILLNMKSALLNKEFFLVFQPKVNFKTLEVEGAEVLVRWKTSSGEMIFPNDFIPLFETNGFSTELDLYVFEQACIFISIYKNRINIPIISVNLSSKSVESNKTLRRMNEIIDAYKLDPSTIEIEITESALIEESISFTQKVRDIRKAGFRVSMDDFGAGFSSLNRLHSLEIDVVKLDKAFLDSNISNIKGTIIVQNIINMARQLHLKVVCEGVESKEQVLWLQQLKCDTAQGYFFDKPLEEKKFVELLNSKKVYSINK